jgi:hypothetical protein
MLVLLVESTAQMAYHSSRLASEYLDPLLKSLKEPVVVALVECGPTQAILKLSTQNTDKIK